MKGWWNGWECDPKAVGFFGIVWWHQSPTEASLYSSAGTQMMSPLRSSPCPFLLELSSLVHSSAKVLRARNWHCPKGLDLAGTSDTKQIFTQCGSQWVHYSQWKLQESCRRKWQCSPVAWWLLILIISITFCSGAESLGLFPTAAPHEIPYLTNCLSLLGPYFILSATEQPSPLWLISNPGICNLIPLQLVWFAS